MKLNKTIKKLWMSLILAVLMTGFSLGETVSLIWNSNPVDQQVTHYNVYRTTVSGAHRSSDQVGTTAGEVDPLDPTFVSVFDFAGQRHYFAVTAVNVNGESSYSNEAPVGNFIFPDIPSVPTGLEATVTD